MKPAVNCNGRGVVSLLLGLVAIAFAATPASATQYAYITNTGSNTASVMDTATRVVITTVPVGEFPTAVAITPDGKAAYVTNFLSNTVSVIDVASNLVVNTIPVGANPQDLAITPDGAFAYVTNNGSNSVSVIDTASNAVATTIGVGVNPALVAITPDGAHAYVTNFGSDTISVIATATNTIAATIPVGSQPQCLVITPDGKFVYAENRLSNTISVIATQSNTVVATIPVPAGSYPNGMAITPNGAFVYVSEYGTATVSVIDTASNTIVHTIAVGSGPCGIAITPDGAFAYVANSGSNTVAIIDTASYNVVATVTVGTAPVWIAITPPPQPPQPLQLIPVTPCRLVDTRLSRNPIQGGAWRDFVVPLLGGCNIPTTAKAYSLNVTAVPHGYLGFLTIWPTGQPRPLASTMNSPDGRYKANAAIVPAGRSGAVSVFVTQTTDVVLDIDGYFAPPPSGTYQFRKLTPCRVIDTRFGSGHLKGPYLHAGAKRDFPVRESSCIPADVEIAAYSMNFTVVPHAAGHPLIYLTVWPQGGSQPYVSTLNNPTATVVANAAIVPAGQNGGISAFAYNDTELIVDISGYFAAATEGSLSYYTTTPCRVYDSRNNNGSPFQGTRPINVAGSACAPSADAQAYVLNATVVPNGFLDYLTLFPDGDQLPFASTLNAYDAQITSNMAIVPTTNGSIDAYASQLTQLILDIAGYFAP